MSGKNNDIQIQWAELVNQAKQGESRAQGQIIELTQSKLFKFCILLGHNRELAEDLCQEVYIKAFRSLHQLKNAQTLQAWLYQIAKHLYIDLKRAKKEEISEAALNELGTESRLETVLQVQQALAQFEVEDRYLLLLIEMEGLSYQEAGEMIGKSEDAVRSKIHRLRTIFIKNFK